MLNSDQLGATGESHFRELCADAGLICNSSERDRAGWDFIVEFPTPEPSIVQTLDKREAAISCHVQVKTMWSRNTRFRMRLSSAERLVKEPKPTFIYIMRFNPDLSAFDTRIIHVHGDFAAEILRHLRVRHSQGQRSANRAMFTVDAKRWGTPIVGTGEAFRREAHSKCSSMLSYIEAKAAHVEQVGYNNHRVQISTTVSAGNYENLVDGFLGLRDLDALEFQAFETRFGIQLPLHEKRDGRNSILRIQPSPATLCQVRIHRGLNASISLAGELFLPAVPGIPEEYQKLIVRTDGFDFTFKRKSLNLQSRIVLNDEELRPLTFWTSYLQAVELFQEGADIDLIAPSKPTITGRICLDGQASGLPRLARVLRCVERVDYISKLAGLANPLLSFGEIVECAEEVAAAYERATQLKTKHHFFRMEPFPEAANQLPKNFDVDMAVPLPIGRHCLAYVARATMARKNENGQEIWLSKKSKMTDIRVLDDFEDAFAAFSDQMRSRSDVNNFGSWVPLPDSPPPPMLLHDGST